MWRKKNDLMSIFNENSFLVFSILWEVVSINMPYGTPDGQAISQARHCTHRSQCSITILEAVIRSSFTAFIKAILPRGDSVSRPVSR